MTHSDQLLTTCREACTAQGLALMAVLPDPGRLPDQGLDQLLADGVGDMGWMADHRDLRLEPARLLPGLRSIVAITWPYQDRLADSGPLKRARYAAGKDYHNPLRKLLAQIGKQLCDEQGQPYAARACVDSAPLLERHLARRAGLGWLGRNALLIHPRHGSYHFLGFLLTAAPLPAVDGAAATDRCGSCTRCQDACPTGALHEGRVLSERCISYLTIEHHGVIARELAQAMGSWWYGCDICQEVCPWNRFAGRLTIDDRLRGSDAVDELLAITAAHFDQYFAGRPQRRIGYERFRRNLLIACHNNGLDCQPFLDEGLDLVTAQARELGII